MPSKQEMQKTSESTIDILKYTKVKVNHTHMADLAINLVNDQLKKAKCTICQKSGHSTEVCISKYKNANQGNDSSQ